MSPAWQLRDGDTAAAATLARELSLPAVVACWLVARGFSGVDEAHRYLEPGLSQLTPPTEMAGLQTALDRLMQAFEQDELIGVFGDYDVDGVSSAALVGDYLVRCGARVALRVARRDEGYGFHAAQGQELVGQGAKLLVLTDCGSHDREAVQELTAGGVDVIAIDHHRVNDASWPGLALVNPQRPDCGFPYKGLCAAGLAFYVMAALRRRLEASGREAIDPRENLDLVALATLADVAPLDGDNRVLVAHGLRRLAATERPGLRELLRLCDLTGKRPSAEDVGWRIGPRLNAPGRLGDAAVSLDCLWQREPTVAVQSAQRCDALNEERKELQRRILDEAREQAAAQADQAFLLVAAQGWHAGVIGIVAGRLAEEFQRPAAVVALEGARGRASARSVPGVDLFALLSRCGDQMVRFGGHAAAAGFTVETDRIEALAAALHEVAAPELAARATPRLQIDALLPLSQIDFDLVLRLERLGPHGEGNKSPCFAATGVRVEMAQIVGADHLRLALRDERAVRQAIGFGLAGSRPEVGELVDVAFVPQIDEYQGLRRLQLRLEAVLPAGAGLTAAS